MSENMSHRSTRDYKLLQAIGDADTVTPDQVIEASKPKNHPWHREIWGKSQSQLARERQVEIARDIIRRVRFRIVGREIVTFRPAYCHSPGTARRYIRVEALAASDDIAQQALQDEMARIIGCIQRARGLAEEFGIAPQLQLLLAEAVRLQKETVRPKRRAA